MKSSRCSGILLHVTSLPSPFGIGDLGGEAYRFVDFLAQAGQRLWQVLPLGPTGPGDSPYESYSAFAWNPLLISLEMLVEDGLLDRVDLEGVPRFATDQVDYAAVRRFKLPLITRACENFLSRATPEQQRDFESFREQQHWLADFALFMALREASGEKAWLEWEAGICSRNPQRLSRCRTELAREVRLFELQQYTFFRQWEALRSYCRERDVRIMGDLPIFVAHNSADVWVHPDFFDLDEGGRLRHVAGVPPDYFSETGQRWGNPPYRWDVLSESGYRWWIDRFKLNLSMFDLVKVDHFRGFEAYWEIPSSEPTAVNGRWVKGPGREFFQALAAELGQVPIVAENLGYITPEVEELRESCSFPGIAVLQFAFEDAQDSSFLPHNYSRDLVVYTGTHDNDTTVGWWACAGEGGRSQAEKDARRTFVRQYLNTNGKEIHWDFIRAALSSVADTAIIPLQDVLGLGSEARMNTPGTTRGNWRWRYDAAALGDGICARLREMAQIYGRTSGCG